MLYQPLPAVLEMADSQIQVEKDYWFQTCFMFLINHSCLSRWWQLKYFLCSPLKLGEDFHPFWRSYFFKGVGEVQPPTRNSMKMTLPKTGNEQQVKTPWKYDLSRCFFLFGFLPMENFDLFNCKSFNMPPTFPARSFVKCSRHRRAKLCRLSSVQFTLVALGWYLGITEKPI